MNFLKCVGKNIRAERHSKELSQEELASISGLHRTYIGAVERGEKNISILNLRKIATALEIEPYLLLKLDETEQ